MVDKLVDQNVQNALLSLTSNNNTTVVISFANPKNDRVVFEQWNIKISNTAGPEMNNLYTQLLGSLVYIATVTCQNSIPSTIINEQLVSPSFTIKVPSAACESWTTILRKIITETTSTTFLSWVLIKLLNCDVCTMILLVLKMKLLELKMILLVLKMCLSGLDVFEWIRCIGLDSIDNGSWNSVYHSKIGY